MAKISISQVLHIRSRVRIFTVMATLVVSAFLFQMMIAQNPQSAKAATASCDAVAKTCYFQNSSFVTLSLRVTFTVSGGVQSLTWRGGNLPAGSFSPVGADFSIMIDGGNTVMTSYGSRSLKDLTIRNRATLTHAALEYNENPITSDKKVDITLSGNLTLESGGKIDVSGKGYPGGIAANNELNPNGTDKGFGPGGGQGLARLHMSGGRDTGVWGAGGSMGTLGGNGIAWRDDDLGHPQLQLFPVLPAFRVGLNIGTSFSDSIFEAGSGGGAAYTAYSPTGRSFPMDGGRGGGRIHIYAGGQIALDTTSTILANGSDGSADADNSGKDYSWAASGGGSGGLIWLEASSFSLPFTYNTQPNGGAGNADYAKSSSCASSCTGENLTGISGVGSSSTFYTSLEGQPTTIFANGGDGGIMDWSGNGAYYNIEHGAGGGSGGLVWVKKIVAPNLTIKKELKPILRAGSGSATECPNPPDPANPNCFNPYALKLNDEIDVVLTISNLIGDVTLTDSELDNGLTGSSRAYCEYIPSSLISGTSGCTVTGADPKDDLLVSPGTNSICEIRYSCQVK